MKLGIITLYGNNNFGNKLQNYALQETLRKISSSVKINTIVSKDLRMFSKIKGLFKKKSVITKRENNFIKFNNYIYYDRDEVNMYFPKFKTHYDIFIIGSDQVWNTSFEGKTRLFSGQINKSISKISYAASFGKQNIDEKYKKLYRKSLTSFSYISVREDRGKEIVEELTGRKDVEVLVDPTMLLTSEEWDKVSKKPTMLKTDKYILNYFLGELSEERKKEINRVAKENNCEVINILDKNSPFYECGPSEFLYLEKHAFLICTDSFHSSVFAILYDTPFLVFDREQKNLVNMNSRLETLLSKFKLEKRKYNGKITKDDLVCDYKEAYKILEKERIKADKFLRKALDIEDSD